MNTNDLELMSTNGVKLYELLIRDQHSRQFVLI
jgi:hypothetical protein